MLKWLENKNQQPSIEIEFLGTIGSDPAAAFLEHDLKAHGIIIDNVVRIEGGRSPLATIIINQRTGSRTITYDLRELPDLTFGNFISGIDISKYSWIHFEARQNLDEVRQMIQYVRSQDPSRAIKLSLEIERASDGRDIFFAEDLDFVFISKDYAKTNGCYNLNEAIRTIPSLLRSVKPSGTTTTLIIGWGEVGAGGVVLSHDHKLLLDTSKSDAFKPKNGVIDTTGAGDAFIASAIFAAHVMNYDLKGVLQFACRFAGAKCGVMGNKNLHLFDSLCMTL